jgi:DNA-binding CsgD family transcriptional regulator
MGFFAKNRLIRMIKNIQSFAKGNIPAKRNTMANQQLLWPQILDYLAEIGAESDLSAFSIKAVQELNRLVPFDAACLFRGDLHPAQINELQLFSLPERIISDYLTYYANLDPYGTEVPQAVHPLICEWAPFRNIEFGTDFLKPQGIRYSLAISLQIGRKNQVVTLTLHRTGRVNFGERELHIVQLIQPHLRNFCSLLIPTQESFAPELALKSKLLSKREMEVAMLLYRRCTAGEIATKLLLSRRTVESYIANIYEKLKVRNRRELIAKLIQHSWIVTPHLNHIYSYLDKISKLEIKYWQAAELARGSKLLSKREAEIAGLLCQYLTMVEIATKLLLSPRTVQTHVENIKEKLRVRNKREMLLKLTGAK